LKRGRVRRCGAKVVWARPNRRRHPVRKSRRKHLLRPRHSPRRRRPTADDPPADKPEADEPAASKPAVTEPAGSPPPPAVPTDDAAPDSKPQPKTPGESDSESPAQPVDPEEMTEAEEDAELLKSVRIGDASPMEQAFEEFDAALEEMRSAQERLDESDTGDATRKLQTRAAQRLEEILKLLQQPPPPSSSSSSSSQQQQQQQQQQGQQGQQPKSGSQRQRGQQSRSRGRPQSRAGARAGRRPRPAGNQPQLAQSRPQSRPQSQTARQAGEAQESERPTGGEERRDPARQKAEEADKRRSDANDVWGHLPPTVREALQKSFNERYLPKYEELVRRYYESLAEKRRESR